MLRPFVAAALALTPVLALAGPDVLAQHGVDRFALETAIVGVLEGDLDAAPMNGWSFFGKATPALAPQVRVALVVAALDVAKTACGTPAVRDALVASVGGEPPEDPRVTFAEEEKTGREQLAAFQATDTSKLPPKDRAQMEEMKKRTARDYEAMIAGQRQQLPAAVKQYELDLADWRKKQRPGAELLKERLQKVLGEFLTGTEAMPWGAKLVKREGKQLFADAALEAKPSWWKAAFRAGKEPVDAARAYAKKWLADLK